jgi:4-carboxymuconolactone decarboxylase
VSERRTPKSVARLDGRTPNSSPAVTPDRRTPASGMRLPASGAGDSVARGDGAAHSLDPLDAETRALVRLSAAIAGGTEKQMRSAIRECAKSVDPVWVEEVVLQSYLFAGLPRTLNAAREWRKASGRSAPADDEGTRYDRSAEWRRRGEKTCHAVYGAMYDALRVNIAELHPALDAWMVVEGYGKVLGRPGLDLARRELCVVAACAVGRQDRQLQSHFHGALNVGAPPAAVEDTLAAIPDFLDEAYARHARMLWRRVRGQHA